MTQQTPEQVASNIIDKYTSPRIPNFNLREAIAAAIREERRQNTLSMHQQNIDGLKSVAGAIEKVASDEITTLREKAAALGAECKAWRKFQEECPVGTDDATLDLEAAYQADIDAARARTDDIAPEYLK